MSRPVRADENIHSRGELAALFFVVGAPEGQSQPEAEMLAEERGVGMDLHGQLPGWRDNQRPGAGVARRQRLGVMQPAVQRDQVGGGLAGARLGLAGDIAAGKRQWQGLFLDGRATVKSRVGDTCLKLIGKRQGGESDLCQVLVRSGGGTGLRRKDFQITFSTVQNTGIKARELAFPDTH